MRGGGGEVKVVSVETRGQPDAGWLAPTISFISNSLYIFFTSYIHIDHLIQINSMCVGLLY